MNIITASNINYKFSRNQQVLKNLNISIPQGSIYGLLGANGAGKTTLLKLMIGLLNMQEGEIKVFDKDLADHKKEMLSKTGTFIETPSVYAHLNAYNNLKVWQSLYNCKPERINEVLHTVGLEKTGDKKAGNFSLGMKQRLAIAIALLNNPELLVLDEPSNGLDPGGIVEMRELLIHLNKSCGITVVISSHILAEIEKTATHIGLLHKGSIIFEGRLEEIVNQHKQCHLVEISASDQTQLLETLKKSERIIDSISNGKVLVRVSGQEDIAALIRFLVGQQMNIYEVRPVREDLESVFMNSIK